MMNKQNAIKVGAVVVLLLLTLGIFVWGPAQEQPDPGPEVHTPSMENIPQGTQLKLDVQPEEGSEEAEE